MNGILSKGFIEIPDPEQKNRVGILLFYRTVLLHQRSVC
jgi:hypothetical protein